MRVLHLPVNNGSRTSHTVRALRAAGIDARGLVRAGAAVQAPEGLEIINLGGRRPSRQLLRAAAPWVARFIRAVAWADVVHWYSGAMALPFGLDLAWVRLLGKPGIVEWQGVEIRVPEVEFAENTYYTEVYGAGYEYRRFESLARSRRLQGRFRAAGFACAAPIGMLQYVQRDIFPQVHILPRRLILADYMPYYPDPGTRRPLVVHSPTAPVTKGTAAVLQAIRELEPQADFEFRLIQGMPRRQALETVRQADIFLDQFVLGDYGSASLEAMAYGKPVICYVKPSLRQRYPSDLPIVNARQEELADTLRLLLHNPATRAELGRQGRRYVETHNNAERVAVDLIEIYRGLLAGRERQGLRRHSGGGE
jgi:hypothetical protein